MDSNSGKNCPNESRRIETGRYQLVHFYFLIFAQRFFCAAEILARAAADIFHVRFFPAFTPVTAAITVATLLPFNAWIAASTPANFLTSEARSS
jgi:hypothetical protein